MKKNLKPDARINLIKTFFNSKLVLWSGILITISTFIYYITLSVLLICNKDDIMDSSGIPSFDLFTGIILVLIYKYSANHDDKIAIPVRVYSVYMNVNVILSVIAFALYGISMFSLILNFDSSDVLYNIKHLLIFPVSLFFHLMFAYIGRKYVFSIRTSISTACSSEGSKEYSLLCFISAGLSLLYILYAVLHQPFSYINILIILPLTIIRSTSFILTGMIARKYSITIPDESYNTDVSDESVQILTHPDSENDTTKVCNPKYIQEIEINTNYEETFYE